LCVYVLLLMLLKNAFVFDVNLNLSVVIMLKARMHACNVEFHAATWLLYNTVVSTTQRKLLFNTLTMQDIADCKESSDIAPLMLWVHARIVMFAF
jgi:hypothetical protein